MAKNGVACANFLEAHVVLRRLYGTIGEYPSLNFLLHKSLKSTGSADVFDLDLDLVRIG